MALLVSYCVTLIGPNQLNKAITMKIFIYIKIITIMLFSTFVHAEILKTEPQALLVQLQQDKAPIILDVRSEQEYLNGHIQGAINIPYDQLNEQKDWLAQYQNQQVVVYCRSGRRAGVAEQILRSQGFNKLSDLQGHILLWQANNYPLFKGNK